MMRVTERTVRVPPRFRWRVQTEAIPTTGADVVAMLLGLRGIPERERGAFLAPPYEASLHDDALQPQCAAATARLRRALRHGEPIAIFGDYDVDGITAAALLAEVLTERGGVVTVDLPHREEGYGLSRAAVERLIPPARLLVTVDNGISATDAVRAAQDRGADVIIIDHHAVNGALPAGALVVHPALPSSRYPNPHLAAVGVVWKVVAALLAAEGRAGQEKYLLDFVCLGTLADSMPLVGENRALVTWGLEVMRHTERPGIQVLLEQVGRTSRSLTADDLTFKLIPRLNAAGRLRHASLALDLLRAPDPGTARRLAGDLEAVNDERRALTEDIVQQLTAAMGEPTPMLFVAGPWPPGLLGIIASRLAESYGRPAVAVAVRDGECQASIRGPSTRAGRGDGVDVMAIVREAEALLTRFGGHAGAAGFSFPAAALPAVGRFFREHGPVEGMTESAELFLDCALPLPLVTPVLAHALTTLEPFGPKNERPRFLIPDVSVVESRAIGSAGDHARFTLRQGDQAAAWSAVAFRWGARPRPGAGERIDVAAEVRYDEFRGIPRADLHVQDLRSPV